MTKIKRTQSAKLLEYIEDVENMEDIEFFEMEEGEKATSNRRHNDQDRAAKLLSLYGCSLAITKVSFTDGDPRYIRRQRQVHSDKGKMNENRNHRLRQYGMALLKACYKAEI